MFPGDSVAHFLLTIFPDAENCCPHGRAAAGIVRYVTSSSAMAERPRDESTI